MDAANPELIERWAAEGILPNLGRLFARGISGRVQGLDGFFIGSTWPSFYTATNPAEHGLHYLVQLRPGSYEFYRPAESEFVRREAFWRRLSRAGHRVAVLDVPLSELDPEINGIQVVEWGGHDAVYGFRTAPAGLADELLEQFGPHPAGSTCDAHRITADEYRAFRDGLVRGAEVKAELTRWLMQREPWDLVMQVFTEAHCAGHQCWHLHDRAHPGHDPGLAAELGDPLRDVYQAVDRAIGAILDETDPTTRILVCSAHGMGAWYSGQMLLPEILTRLGAAQRPGTTPATTDDRTSGMLRLARAGWRSLPAPVKRLLAPLRNQVRPPDPPRMSWTMGLDPAASACFPVGNGFPVGGIRLNLIGREPGGLIAPGEAARAFTGQLAGELLAITEADTGAPLVRRVIETSTLYQGEHQDALPDLLVEWNEALVRGSTMLGDGANAVLRVRSPRIGELEAVNRYGRTGDHRPHGFFVATGPGLGPSRLSTPVSLMDFAPSVETWAGLIPPPGSGRVIEPMVSTSGHP
ncbi:MAG TPA: alkaline phosphatase family protein [Gemmatimonadales bacterium]|nr:alkaline phosphatase family protein [Gemmatimonadales bacterium]